MSLLVWLPMTKDLTQQGLSDITVSNVGATLDNNGKLGKCYYFDGNAHYLEFSKSVGDLYSGDFSYAVWLKPMDDTRSVICSEYASSGASNIAFELSASRQVRLYWNGSPDISSTGCILPKSQWTHIAITRSGNEAKFYMDGELKYTYTGTLANKTSTAKIRLGDDYRGGTSVSYMGYMNDFRIYDHALSAKEIEVLSRGLVCHYPLNGSGRGGDNLYTEPYWKYSTTKWGYGAQVGTVRPVLNSDGSVTFTGGGGTNSQCYIHHIGNRVAISSNTTYTVSCKITASGSGTFRIYLYQYDSSGTRIGNTITTIHNFADGETKTISNTITTTSTTASFYAELNMYGSPTTSTMLLHANSLKLEKGDKVTPWMPNSADTAYSAMGYNSTTEYDVSGNGYNGTKNGTLTYLTDTPRYNVSTNIKGASSYIQIPNLTTTGFNNSYSFAWWGKVPSYQGYMMWGFSDGVRLNGIFNGNLWNTGDGASNPLYIPGTTTQVTVPTVNVWHHWVMTGDGTTCKVYQDGVLWGQAKTYKPISGTTIYLNGWDAGTSYTYGDYQMSDFRLYATALSAEQVAELYNTAVSVANNGTLMGYELVEV